MPSGPADAAVKHATNPSETVLQRYAYAYDPAGNRTVEQIDDSVTLSSYDPLNRLTAQAPGGPLVVAGLLNEPGTVTIAGVPATVDATNAFRGTVPTVAGVNTFTVVARDAAGNQTSQAFAVPVTGQTRTSTYDANGNTLSDGVRVFEWDASNRLVSVAIGAASETYQHDGQGRLVGITTRDGVAVVSTRQFIGCGGSGEYCEERDASGVVLLRKVPQGLDDSSGQHLTTKDHLGSVREVVSAASLQSRIAYDPWGRSDLQVGSMYREGYGGYRHSALAGWITQFRSLDSSLGRWSSPDPIGMFDGLNLYTYVRNQPLALVDPSGLVSIEYDLKWSYRPEVDTVCPESAAGGCWLEQGWAPRCSCSGRDDECQSPQFRARASARVSGVIHVATFPTRRKPTFDKNAKDAPTRTYHEWMHVYYATAAGLGPLAAVEVQVFASRAECESACTQATRESFRRFRNALRATAHY